MNKRYYEINRRLRFERRVTLNFPFHLHNDVELIYCLKGSACACCDGKEYTIRPNDFFLVFPNQTHRFYNCDTAGEYYVIILKAQHLGEYASVFSNAVPESALHHYDPSQPEDAILLSLFFSAWRDYMENEAFGMILAQITVILAKLLKHYTLEKAHSPDTMIRKIVQYCNDHYADAISIDDICAHLKVSRSHVSHLFHDKFKTGFCEYINALRLNDAEHLLKSTDDSVTTVALDCGFSTVRTFNRAFLKKHGVSPTAYRSDYFNRLTASAQKAEQ